MLLFKNKQAKDKLLLLDNNISFSITRHKMWPHILPSFQKLTYHSSSPKYGKTTFFKLP